MTTQATSSPEALVGQAEDGRFVDRGVLVDRGLDLGRVDVLAGAQDHVLDAVLDVEVPVVVDVAQVAGSQPPVDEVSAVASGFPQ
jgi:hypothetical protein